MRDAFARQNIATKSIQKEKTFDLTGDLKLVTEEILLKLTGGSKVYRPAGVDLFMHFLERFDVEPGDIQDLFEARTDVKQFHRAVFRLHALVSVEFSLQSHRSGV